MRQQLEQHSHLKLSGPFPSMTCCFDGWYETLWYWWFHSTWYHCHMLTVQSLGLVASVLITGEDTASHGFILTSKHSQSLEIYVRKVIQRTWNLNIPHWLFMSSNTQFLVIKVSPVTSASKMFGHKTDTVTQWHTMLNILRKNKSAFNSDITFLVKLVKV